MVFTAFLAPMCWVVAGLVAVIIPLWYAFLRPVPSPLPGPKPHPIFGCLPVVRSTTSKQNTHTLFCELNEKYGTIVGMPMPGKRLVVIIDDAKDITTILGKPKVYGRSVSYKSGFGAAIKHGLLILEGEEWKQHRRTVTPLFHPRSLTRVVPSTNEACDELFKAISSRHGSLENIPMHNLLCSLTIDVISSVGFGGSIRSLRADEGMRDALHHLMRGIILRLRSMKPLHRFLSDREVFQASKDLIRTRLRDVLLAHMAEKEASEGPGSEGANLLQLLLDNAGTHSWSQDVIIDELVMFYLAGHETSSNSLARIVQLLARHPEVLAKLVQEVHRVVGKEGSEVKQEHLAELKYAQAIYIETLRLLPTAPFTGRTNRVDVELQGYKVPAGSILLCNFQAAHRKEANYPQPLTWRPERWMPEPKAQAAAAKHKLFAFGSGPQACVGINLAKFEMLTVIARLAQWVGEGRQLKMSANPPYKPLAKGLTHFTETAEADFTNPDHKLSGMMCVTARPRHGVFIDVVPRE